ncbi:XapX domain-containing protein [Tahibacter caeni]|uniref:XapX domain-containing protein n=1 Tax=Tahibacter caeni TaxID=1453545 RepID=UPI002147A96B|nr:XapX domain-containing protein [Tahibacter caeni]
MSFLISLAVGFAFGAGYALLGVRSPAPPLVALAGLLGILAGEHFIPWARQQWPATVVAEHRAPPEAGGDRPEPRP